LYYKFDKHTNLNDEGMPLLRFVDIFSWSLSIIQWIIAKDIVDSKAYKKVLIFPTLQAFGYTKSVVRKNKQLSIAANQGSVVR